MSSRRLNKRAILKDDQAQALTEYVIVIPFILMMFFAALQTMVIAQTAQLVNYAAFIGARSYATSYGDFKKDDASTAHDEAKERAQRAVTLCLAPVSHAQFGEGLFLLNPIRGVMSSLPEIVERLYALAEGYLIAYVYRIKNFDVTQPTPGDTNPQATIRCTFDYMCPLSIPGLAQLWNYFYEAGSGGLSTYDQYGTFEQQFELGAPFADVGELSNALNGAQDALVELGQFFNSLGSNSIFGSILGGLGLGSIGNLFHELNLVINGLRTGIYSIGVLGAPSNIRIPGECTMGFEPWELVRVAGGHEDQTSGTSEYDDCLQDLQTQQTQVEAQQDVTDDVCNEAQDLESEYNDRESELQACQNQPGNPNCSSEQSARNSAFNAWDAKKDECIDEGNTLADMNDDLANFSCP